MNIIKTPQDDINAFLYNSINIDIFENLNKICDPKINDFDPLYFFNLIYKEADFYFNNDNSYLTIKNHFNEMDIIIFEGMALTNLLLVIGEVYKNSIPNEIQLKSFEFLKEKLNPFDDSDKNILQSIITEYTLYNFKNRINVYKNNEDKINYIIDIKARFLQEVIDYQGWQSNNSFDKKCDIEIERLKSKTITKNNHILTESKVITEALTIKKANEYKDTIWFKTGLKLATGEAYDLYYKYKLDKGHFTKLCLELGFKVSDRTYFSSTINDNETDKNTFTDKSKLQKLYKHLTENDLPLGTEFLEKYNQIETE